MNDHAIVEHTRRWISSFVIGLGLCPFARRVFDAGRIRFVISHSRDKLTLASDLASELHLLLAAPTTQTETTLLIHPHVLGNFLEYNDFLDVVDQLLERTWDDQRSGMGFAFLVAIVALAQDSIFGAPLFDQV